jgi:hypothetical protein
MLRAAFTPGVQMVPLSLVLTNGSIINDSFGRWRAKNPKTNARLKINYGSGNADPLMRSLRSPQPKAASDEMAATPRKFKFTK